MKDIIITRKRQLRELLILFLCFIIDCLLNLYAILTYGGKVSELFTSLGYVLVFTLALYAALAACRVMFAILRRLIKNKHK